MITTTENKILLNEVVFIRVFAISSIFIVHSFAIFTGVWDSDLELPNIFLYKWLPRIFSGFRLQVLVFLAGYVVSYQTYNQQKRYNLNDVARKKFFRLILPGLFFGLLYYLMFIYSSKNYSFTNSLFKILNGPGHLWFLPMMFWIFVTGKILEPILKDQSSIIVLSLMFLCSSIYFIIPLPFGIQNAIYYIFFYFIGFLTYRNRTKIISRLSFIPSKPIIFIALYLISFFILNILINYFSVGLNHFGLNKDLNISKGLTLLFSTVIRTIISIIGIFILYSLTFHYLLKYPANFSGTALLFFNKNSYGMYVYHQFILRALLLTPIFVNSINVYFLPFILLFVSFTFSILFSHLTLKTRFGRYLIG